jgi:hypothetical protein
MSQKREEGLTDFNDLGGLDPAVEAIIREGGRRRRESQLPVSERKKRVRERKKSQSRRGRRAVYDLPPDMIAAVKELAEAHRVPASQVAALLLTVGLEALEGGEVDIDAYKVPSDSPRYEWNLDLGQEEE